ncbi:MAG: hypothetical protein COV29_00875 [Candidatus Yanofskybacteria bacterium CG10_big_fil_rev_8_21_14_0_10_36_16]|uniref:Uncharacterized protein n=1 Tax=Candidatus Yanofskybacteria bacterium CG10_big_fil_rev_8_21_14_0_10_36_16 TaxID=1975096 RepID=A0A2J0Q804_9BACT|nr:MAG: hypothetical protein COV29_00875 [Candidatus Yanofskybacteria bacterium CG10_big_fil_rev_8_21_14_0_10_36_16]
MFKKFWEWYEKHEELNTIVSAGLFVLQLVHLYWLTTDVVLMRIFGISFFFQWGEIGDTLLAVVDYTEIPVLISVSLIYINSIRKNMGSRGKNILYLIFLNSQWYHIFWITDEVVVESFLTASWHPVLIWGAILIDYLELPVIYDTIKKTIKTFLVRK